VLLIDQTISSGSDRIQSGTSGLIGHILQSFLGRAQRHAQLVDIV
jgi:hypothetical protein